MTAPTPPAPALDAFRASLGAAPTCTPIAVGLIHQTWRVAGADECVFVLQRVSDIFPPGITERIDRVTQTLRAAGDTSFRVVPSDTGETEVVRPDGRFRLLSYVEGRSLDRIFDPAHAEAAGRALGRFHARLAPHADRIGPCPRQIHDLRHHLDALAHAEAEAGAQKRAQLAPLFEAIQADPLAGAPFEATRTGVTHGDPKASNLRFHPDRAEALCWLDLDTVGTGPLDHDWGDALRSWCADGTEDAGDATFCLDQLQAALAGYRSGFGDPSLRNRGEAFLHAAARITLELAARFCRDAFEESYFGWDPARFSSSNEHQKRRCETQLALLASLRAQWPEAKTAADRALAGD